MDSTTSKQTGLCPLWLSEAFWVSFWVPAFIFKEQSPHCRNRFQKKMSCYLKYSMGWQRGVGIHQNPPKVVFFVLLCF